MSLSKRYNNWRWKPTKKRWFCRGFSLPRNIGRAYIDLAAETFKLLGLYIGPDWGIGGEDDLALDDLALEDPNETYGDR